jgi:hypothetical protein
MEDKIFTAVIILMLGVVFTPTLHAQEDARLNSSINVNINTPKKGASFRENEEFTLEATAVCNSKLGCGIIELRPQYCLGSGCESYEYIETKAYASIYSKDRILHKCLNVKKGEKCSKPWRIKTKRSGIYRLRTEAISNNVPTAYSDIVSIKVIGCGDGNCSGNETHLTCPDDCCNLDCTANDDICHDACRGYNGCSLTMGCDGKIRGDKVCISPNSFTTCCNGSVETCGYGEYCSDAVCEKCQSICDNICESKVCYGLDPDCDMRGNATGSCCGNNILDAGEECDGNATKTLCDGGCKADCTCVTTTSSTSTTTTSTTIYPSISTSISIISTTTSEIVYVTTTTAPSTTSTIVTSNVSSITFPIDIDPGLIIPVAVFTLILIALLCLYIKRQQKRKGGSELENDGVERWVKERLDAGEDPELLKKGVIKAGLDPRIVDKIKRK